VGQSTEELTTRIDETRRRMAADLDTLQDRVSPSAIVERRKQAVRGRFASVKDKVMGSAQSTGSSVTDAVSAAPGSVASTAQERYEGAPLAAGVVAFGAGVVLASLLPASRAEAEAAHRVVETAKEQGQPVLEEARTAARDVADRVRESAQESAQHVKESAQESARTVQDETQSSVDTVRDETTSS
jgi:gas vesicle protein